MTTAWQTEDEGQIVSEVISKRSLKIMEILSRKSDYWKSCYQFIISIENRDARFLTPKQRDWYDSIEANINAEVHKVDAVLAWSDATPEQLKKTHHAYNQMFSGGIMNAQRFSSD